MPAQCLSLGEPPRLDSASVDVIARLTSLKLLVACTVVSSLMALVAPVSALGGELFHTKPRTVYFMEGPSGAVFNPQVLEVVARNAGLVILNFPLKSVDRQTDFQAIVDRLHRSKPELPVLMYTWLTCWYPHHGRIGTQALEGYQNQPLLSFGQSGEEAIKQLRAGQALWADIRDEGYRKWVLERMKSAIARTGVDGVLFDMVVMKPPDQALGPGRRFPAGYDRDLMNLMRYVHSGLSPKMVLFNSLADYDPSTRSPDMNQVTDHERLLEYTEGVSVEHFGRHPSIGVGPFRQGILFLEDALRAHQQKLFLVFGRGPWKYNDYDEDYLWQRYLFCSYLLLATPNTMFKYHSTFQVPNTAGRSGGLDYYADWDIDLGEPMGPYGIKDGVYYRKFSKGLVLVAPHDGPTCHFDVSETKWTPEGLPQRGQIEFSPGRGVILLSSPRAPLGMLQDGAGDIRAVPLPPRRPKRDGLRPSGEGATEGPGTHTDILLSAKRVLNPPGSVQFKISDSNPLRAILVVCEVDDSHREHSHVLVQITGANAAQTMTPEMVQSHLREMAFAPSNAPRIIWPGALSSDDSVQTITLDTSQLGQLAPRYKMRRAVQARVIYHHSCK
ncbi:MAG: putative glycoside hydrolase [Desulfomonilaceae bacterium]